MTRITGIALALLAANYLSACGGGQELTRPTATVARVEVSPQTDTLTALGETQDFKAVAKDAGDNAISGQSFTWTSLRTMVATVTASGRATAVGPGSTTITATTAGVSGTASLYVFQVATTVDVTPRAATLTALGDTVWLTAVPKDANDQPAPRLGRIRWTSSATGVVGITRCGGFYLRCDHWAWATAVSYGTATITATLDTGISGSATVTVSQGGAGSRNR